MNYSGITLGRNMLDSLQGITDYKGIKSAISSLKSKAVGIVSVPQVLDFANIDDKQLYDRCYNDLLEHFGGTKNTVLTKEEFEHLQYIAECDASDLKNNVDFSKDNISRKGGLDKLGLITTGALIIACGAVYGLHCYSNNITINQYLDSLNSYCDNQTLPDKSTIIGICDDINKEGIPNIEMTPLIIDGQLVFHIYGSLEENNFTKPDALNFYVGKTPNQTDLVKMFKDCFKFERDKQGVEFQNEIKEKPRKILGNSISVEIDYDEIHRIIEESNITQDKSFSISMDKNTYYIRNRVMETSNGKSHESVPSEFIPNNQVLEYKPDNPGIYDYKGKPKKIKFYYGCDLSLDCKI